MRRPRSRKPLTGVSLFPFLAVLICTMGALIVLLVMVVHQARVHATEVRSQDDEAALEPLADPDQLAADDHQWQREQLEQQRDRLIGELAGHRSELGHLEQHIRELEERGRQLQAQAEALTSAGDPNRARKAALEAEAERVRQAIALERRRLDDAQRKAAEEPRSYAIVPYRGPNGSFRRPIFIECTAEGIILQPEGIVLTESDFRGPLGPGNPLDAALRATREYLAGVQAAGEPYPLLLVRPGGAEAYAVARSAMRDWDDEFGYELLDADMPLAFPEADPQLKQQLGKVIADARRRQELLAAALPRRFQEASSAGYVASSNRGFVRAETSDNPLTRAGLGTGTDRRYSEGRNQLASDQSNPVQPRQTRTNRFGEAGHAQGSPNAGLGQGVPNLAKKRGSNWGLPGATSGATGITRPIRVACLANSLIILPEKGEHAAPQKVLLRGPMVRDIDKFVARLWVHMEKWGIAVLGGYWQPVLHVEVAPGGERRFQELQSLLRDSGIAVVRSKP